MAVTPVPQRVEVRTADRDEAAEAVNRVVAHEARMGFDDPGAVDLGVRAVTYGDLGAMWVRLAGVRYSARASTPSTLLAGIFTEGRAAIRTRDRDFTLGARDSLLYTGETATAEYDNCTQLFLLLPEAFVTEVAEARSGVPAADIAFESGTPVSEAKRRFWTRTAEFLAGQLIASGVDHPPLVVDSFLRQAAAAVVTVFPNTTMTVAHVAGPGRVSRAVVRRAAAFIDAHADEPLAVARIAAAAGVGARDLREAFRRHLDTTPTEYLRRVRLERAHRELLAGNPPDGAALDRIARRWGFTDSGRFVDHYRAAFGRPPRLTWPA